MVIMKSLEPRLIEVFQAVVETGSATLAGERLRMTQPAVTRSIAHLETRTGLGLFERGRFGMRLTAVGELFAEEVRVSFAGLGRLSAAADSLRQGLRGRIVVGAYPIYAEGVVADVMGELAAEAPDLSIRIDVQRDDEIVRRILHGEVDIGVLPGPVSLHAQLNSRALAPRRLMAVMRPSHPLANRAELTIPELGQVEIIHYSPLNVFRGMVEEAFARMTTPIRHRIEVVTQRAALKLAMRSDAIALTDQDSIREIVDQFPGLRALPLVDGPAWDVVMLWSRERALTPLQARALERLADGFASARSI
jgi:DNA-binding transcriptional LysR family regulator